MGFEIPAAVADELRARGVDPDAPIDLDALEEASDPTEIEQELPTSQPSDIEHPESFQPREGRFHHDGQDTERLAAKKVAPKSGTQRHLVIEHFRTVGAKGSTDYETGIATKMFRHVAGTRREELMKDGWRIIDSGSKRLTDTGTSAIVWALHEEGAE